MKISAIKCKDCDDVIYARARHDYRECSCGSVAIDGGFDYVKVGFKVTPPGNIEINLKNMTKKKLFDDWNSGRDNYGKIKGRE